MKFDLLYGDELTDDLSARWAAIQEAQEEFASPYFRPEFTSTLAGIRTDVAVGVLFDSGEPVGFFPFHRRFGRIGQPVGLGLSDYHGVIARPDCAWSVEQLLYGCGLRRFRFDHLIASQAPFAGWCKRRADSPIIRLSNGWDAYEASRDRSGRKQLREIERRRGRLADEVGPVRFFEHVTDAVPLETLFQWKSSRCRSTGVFDFFSLKWTRELLKRLQQQRSSRFGGRLACLYAGERLIAVHFLLQTRQVWHSWFPAFDDAFAPYSPGRVLLLDLIRCAAQNGVSWIDLGKGVSTYKAQFMNDAIEVAEGVAEVPALVNSLVRVRSRIDDLNSKRLFKPLLRVPVRLVAALERRWRYA